jgi:YegS/Rv2252/BmrU family lipid kinase
MKIKLIVNSKAGSYKNKIASLLLPKIVKKLKKSGITVDLFFTKKKNDAFKEAKVSLNYDAIVASGGDGTINEVVNGIGTSGIPLGIIPLGTVNLLPKELKIPQNPLKACETIIKGNVKKIDLGKAGEHYFTLMAGIGFDAEVINNMVPKVKRILGGGAYFFSGIKMLTEYKPTLMSVKIEDTIERMGYFIVVSNAKRYADITDGLLDVCIFRNLLQN